MIIEIACLETHLLLKYCCLYFCFTKNILLGAGKIVSLPKGQVDRLSIVRLAMNSEDPPTL
jgi:hypothetical protein